jgi:hypothetical protein
MKRILFLAMLIVKGLYGSAQNLVPNPSFEDTVACPRGIGNIEDAVAWSAYRITPDYFNPCNYSCTLCNVGDAAVPSNKCGYQYARTGTSYAGFGPWASQDGANIREWFGAQLTDSLVIGERYKVEFFVSMAFTKSAFKLYVATNKIGARFSTVPYSPVGNNLPLNGYCHVYTDSVIADTTNWVSVSGSFIADSAYKYIIIGNFFDDFATTHITLDTVPGYFPSAYYYVDDVSVFIDSSNSINVTNHDNSVKIFPNPARDWIVVEGKGIKSVEVLNALGSNLRFYPLTASTLQHQLNLRSLSQGIYFLKINMIDEGFINQKIILQN